jgi:hypothetical protein
MSACVSFAVDLTFTQGKALGMCMKLSNSMIHGVMEGLSHRSALMEDDLESDILQY